MFNEQDTAYFDELLKRQSEAQNKKKVASILGMIGDSMASGTSAGHMFLGRQAPRSTMGRDLAQMMPDEDPLRDEMQKTAFLTQRAGQRNDMALGDAGSELSQKQREMYQKLVPGVDLTGMSAKQMKEAFPVLHERIQKMDDRQYSEGLTAQERAFKDKNREAGYGHDMNMELLRQQGQIQLADTKAARQKNGTDQVTKRNQDEFAKRYKNIMDQIDKADSMVASDGLYNFFGPHTKNLQQSMDSIAIDSAKMFDPESVARESEVRAMKAMLLEPSLTEGATTRKSTAREILANYRDNVRKRAMTEMGMSDDKNFEQYIAEVNKILPPEGALKSGRQDGNINMMESAVAGPQGGANVIELDLNGDGKTELYRITDDGDYERL